MANAGKKAPAGEVNLIRGSSVDKPLVRLIQQSTQSIANNTDVAITFGASSEEIDTAGWHDVGSNTSRITPNNGAPCYVNLRGKVWWVADTDLVEIHASIGRNGTIVERTTIILPSTATASKARSVEVFARLTCNGSTDYFELFGKQVQAATGSLGTNIAAGMSCVFEAEYLRPQ